MKKITLLFLFLTLVALGFSQKIPADSLYLGQSYPGNVPKVFQVDVSPGHFAAERIAISNDGTEIYYSELKAYYPITSARIKY